MSFLLLIFTSYWHTIATVLCAPAAIESHVLIVSHFPAYLAHVIAVPHVAALRYLALRYAVAPDTV